TMRLRAELTAMGVGSASAAQERLAASIKAANVQLDAQRIKMERQQRIEQRMAALTQAHAKTMKRLGIAGAAAAGGMYAGRRIVQAGLSPVGAFMQHEDAMLGIARQVPGARDSAGNLTQVYRDAEAQVRALSTRLPQTTVQIADMMTAAARMEVPTDQLGMFVELASEMGTAFDTVPGEIAESMGKIAKNLKIPVTEIRGMADTINYLDDNAISKGADIIGALNRVSGITGTVGITGQNMAALVSTLLTSGETEETTGTGIKAIFTNLSAATRMPKRFQRGISAIGMSGQQIQTGMAKDAVGTLLKVVEAINKLPSSERIGVMADIAGKEHVGRLAKLASNTEEFRRQLALANGEEAQGSMAREAEARNRALTARWQMFKNAAFNLNAAVGESLKPALVSLMDAVVPLIDRMGAWVKENPALAGGILKVVIGLGALLTAASAVGLAIVTTLGPLAIARFMLSRWLLTLAGARVAAAAAAPAMSLLYRAGFMLGRAFVWLKAAGSALLIGLRVLAAFLIANPIVLAIGLLAAAGYMLYSRWADVVGGFKLLMQDIGAAVSGAAQYVVGLGARFFDAGAAIMQGMY
ncbi:MAG: phage tail tape measure protein, partial [Rhodanobacter sp.]|nr:phage tail tape measure protein [Rhodanobacter sp.]